MVNAIRADIIAETRRRFARPLAEVEKEVLEGERPGAQTARGVVGPVLSSARHTSARAFDYCGCDVGY